MARPGPAEQIAAHLLYASAHEPFAVAILRDAARQALAHGSADAAIAYLRCVVSGPLDPGARAEILIELGLAEKLVDLPAAVDHLREALDLIGDDKRRAQVGAHLARALFSPGARRRPSARTRRRSRC